MSWTERKCDVMIFGMSQFFRCGGGMGTSPIILVQATSAQVVQRECIMSGNCVTVYSSLCNGYFHDELWLYTREMYDMFQHDFIDILPDMDRYGEYFATNEEYIRKYRYCSALHPFHGLSTINCGHIAGVNTSAIYPCDAQKSGYVRGMGLKTRATIEETLADIKKKFVGQNSSILVLPQTSKLGAVHLVIKDEAYKGKGQKDYRCTCHMHGQMI